MHRATQDRRVMAKHDPLEEGMTNHSRSCENTMNCIKRQRDMTSKYELLRWEGVQHASGDDWRKLLIASERIKQLGQSGNDLQL